MAHLETVLYPLLVWQQIILLYAVMLGLEGPALLLAAYRYRRPRGERLLAIVPVAACCALLLVARALRDTYAFWLQYGWWQVAHYTFPPGFPRVTLAQTADDAARSAKGAAPLGIALAALTAALLMGGWALVVRWQAPPASQAPRAATPPSAGGTGTLEITVEPITVASDTTGE